jgi:hypothetical protein
VGQVTAVVAEPRMISTKAIMGTGLKKCMPMKRSARAVTAANCVMEIRRCRDAMMTSGRQQAHTTTLLQNFDFEVLVLSGRFDH